MYGDGNPPELERTIVAIMPRLQDDFTVMELFEYSIWLTNCPPEAFEFLLNQGSFISYLMTLDGWDICELFEPILSCFWKSSDIMHREITTRKSRANWCRIFKMLVTVTVNIYNAGYDNYDPLLRCLLDYCTDPDDSRAMAAEWLEVLASSDVDIQEYLLEVSMSPMAISPRDKVLDGSECKRQVKISLEGTPSVYWDWLIDPEEPASLVCDEFKTIGHHQVLDWIIDTVTVELYSLDHVENYCPYWPYSCPRYCEDSNSSKPSIVEEVLVKDDPKSKICEKERNPYEDQIKERFERRMRKKAAKQRKAMGFGKEPKMPGAWIE